jgi:outer membrane protein assembly factor BamA
MNQTVKKLFWMLGIFSVGMIGLVIADQYNFIERVKGSGVGHIFTRDDTEQVVRELTTNTQATGTASVKNIVPLSPTPAENRARIDAAIKAKKSN